MKTSLYMRHTSDEKRSEWCTRVMHLILVRKMSERAARTVVDASMFGIGCTEGTVRKLIEEKQREEKSRPS